ncbi:ribonuclease H [Denitrovibrio acetiphilus DSM 12809]|uniref:Ribonuclease H n=1 Tax=Denitrovibrio acetiphilus (strain DSM 12809 / NBRC 114555 / N2460) TaxID=522772 RepID=D4H0K1_DENA2|nr:ribonuclease HI family protein [Denitrovibrio acetiphilus]ADD68514.1 ribonuclease H [Denitrovibrio acetiphilus DSM 12809]
MPDIKIFSDGACRGNPGPAGCGYIIYADGQEIASGTKFIGTATNNLAEYNALLVAAKDPILNQFDKLNFYLDSELVVKQMKGEYKLKNEGLIPVKLQIDKVLNGKQVTFNHVPRAQNKEADKLANMAIDEHSI